MNPVLLLTMFGHKPVLNTVTFNSSQTWVAPSIVLLNTVIGHGVNGTPDTSYSYEYYYTHYITRYYRRSDGTPEDVDGGTAGPTYGTTPSDYLGPFIPTPDSTVYTGYNQIREYTQGFDTGGSAGTIGADATGFGFTFAGGVYVNATTFTHNNVTITSGGSYALVIPSGATIQITYYT